jgi:hypothetical protein
MAWYQLFFQFGGIAEAWLQHDVGLWIWSTNAELRILLRCSQHPTSANSAICSHQASSQLVSAPGESRHNRPNVRFVVRQAEPSLIVPASTLVIRDQDVRIATVTPDHRVIYKNVKLGRDFGTTTEILDGLNDNDLLVLNPPPDLAEGTEVVPQLLSSAHLTSPNL